MQNYPQSEIVKNSAVRRGWQPLLFDTARYNYEQLLEIYAGHLSGIDVMQLADPRLSSDEMAEIRERLADEIGYEPTPEDIAELDSVCPERVFLKDISNALTEFSEELSLAKGHTSIANTLATAGTCIELTEKSLLQLDVELYPSERRAQIRAGKYVYQYELSLAEGYAVLTSLTFVNFVVKTTTPGLVVI